MPKVKNLTTGTSEHQGSARGYPKNGMSAPGKVAAVGKGKELPGAAKGGPTGVAVTASYPKGKEKFPNSIAAAKGPRPKAR